MATEKNIISQHNSLKDIAIAAADLSQSTMPVGKYITNSAVLAPLSYTVPTITLEEAFNSNDTNEEWIWVEGYKATDKDMKCRDYQYKLGKQYDMPEGSKISACSSGFHLCLNLGDVFGYYQLGNGNRFFKVSALVRKNDKKRYASVNKNHSYFFFGDDKLAAKSIIFTKELTPDEIFKDTEWAAYDEEFKKEALATSPIQAVKSYQINKLVKFGYSEPLAKKIVNRDNCGDNMFELACALETQPGISMDTKIIALFAY